MSTQTPMAAPTSVFRSSGPLVLLILINVFNYVDRQVLAAIEKPIADDFRASQFAMGWLVTGFLLVYMCCAPIFGWWADRNSKWKLIGFSMILQSLASGGSGLATTYLMLLIMRCAVGVGEAAWGPAAPSLLSDMYPVEKRGRILAFFYAAIPVGSALGYAVGGAMLHLTDKWQWAFYVLMPPGVLIGIICFFMRDPPRAVGVGPSPPASFGVYLQLFRIRSFTIACIGMTLMTFALGGIALWMPRYLQVDRGLGPNATIIFGGVAALSGLLATITGGSIGDRLRGRFSGSYFYVSAAGMLLGFPLFLWVLATPNSAWQGSFPYAWAVLFAGIFCLFLNTGPGNTILSNVSPANMRSRAFALNIFIIHLLGDAISPPLIGAIADHSKTATSSGIGVGFFWTSIMMAIGGIVWWFGARYLEEDTRKANAVDVTADRGFEVEPKPATIIAP